MAQSPLYLALDTGSPVVSLALGTPGEQAASATLELRRSSEGLLSQVAELIRQKGAHLSDLSGVLVARGPGSFTGLRVGLATALGLHQALALRCTALDTLPILARTAGIRAKDGDQVIAAVDALRGEWMTQTFAFEGGEPQILDRAALRPAAELVADDRPLIGFELGALEHAGAETSRLWQAPPLAPFMLQVAAETTWDPGLLVQPIYFRPPAVTPPTSSPFAVGRS